AYHLKIAAVQSISFGLSAGVMDNHVNLSNIRSESPADPYIINNQDVRATTFDASFGILYRYQKLNFGIVVPRLLESKINDEEENLLYQLKMHYRVHLSYLFDIDKDWQVEPFVVINKSANGDLFYEVAPLVKYKQLVWLAPTYRKENSFAINIGGVPYNNFIVNYSYEFSGDGMLGSSSGTHEVSIGYLFGKGKTDVPPPDSKKPYYEWMGK
ncbi:MAG: PorP/SprF family type IX secretion system membrane protein, partial [Bacteroidota bacterium]